MKNILLFLYLFISLKAYCQEQEPPMKYTIQEGEIYYFDMRKHICGQKYYIKMESDTILVNRNSMDLEIDYKELPIKVDLTISGNDNRSNCTGNYKTLSYIERKEN